MLPNGEHKTSIFLLEIETAVNGTATRDQSEGNLKSCHKKMSSAIGQGRLPVMLTMTNWHEWRRELRLHASAYNRAGREILTETYWEKSAEEPRKPERPEWMEAELTRISTGSSTGESSGAKAMAGSSDSGGKTKGTGGKGRRTSTEEESDEEGFTTVKRPSSTQAFDMSSRLQDHLMKEYEDDTRDYRRKAERWSRTLEEYVRDRGQLLSLMARSISDPVKREIELSSKEYEEAITTGDSLAFFAYFSAPVQQEAQQRQQGCTKSGQPAAWQTSLSPSTSGTGKACIRVSKRPGKRPQIRPRP